MRSERWVLYAKFKLKIITHAGILTFTQSRSFMLLHLRGPAEIIFIHKAQHEKCDWEPQDCYECFFGVKHCISGFIFLLLLFLPRVTGQMCCRVNWVCGCGVSLQEFFQPYTKTSVVQQICLSRHTVLVQFQVQRNQFFPQMVTTANHNAMLHDLTFDLSCSQQHISITPSFTSF